MPYVIVFKALGVATTLIIWAALIWFSWGRSAHHVIGALLAAILVARAFMVAGLPLWQNWQPDAFDAGLLAYTAVLLLTK